MCKCFQYTLHPVAIIKIGIFNYVFMLYLCVPFWFIPYCNHDAACHVKLHTIMKPF